MKKILKVLAILLVLIIQAAFAQTSAIWDGTADTTWYTNNKSESEFTITTAEQLSGLARLVNGGTSNGHYSMDNKTIKLGANIMLNNTTNWQNWATNPPARSWTPIGNFSRSFEGKFDGAGFVISGVYINSTANYQGLFGNTYYSTIENLGVSASYIKGGDWVGGLAGYGIAVINCYFNGIVSGKNRVGGLVGSTGMSRYNYSTGTVTGENMVGGLAGLAGTMGYSYSTGTVTGDSIVGGLIGHVTNGIGNSYSTGTVNGRVFVGGLVGILYNHAANPTGTSTVGTSYSTGAVTGQKDVGGLLGGSIGNSEVIYSYYDSQTSKQSDVGKGEGKTTTQMKQIATFLNWDFSEVWGVSSAINGGYPHLRCFHSSAGCSSSSEASSSSSSGNSSSSAKSIYWDGTVNTAWYNATQNEFIITTAEELAGFASLVSDKNDFFNKTIKLGANIMLNDATSTNAWTPIGYPHSFRGTFDGNNYAISGVYINSTSGNRGLFGIVGSDGEVKNLGVIASNIYGGTCSGGLAGRNNSGIVSNSYFVGSVSGQGNIGGLVGCNRTGAISNSYFVGSVLGGSAAGGLSGSNGGIISNSYSTGTVSGTEIVSGLVSMNTGMITNSYSTSTVTGSNTLGGLVATNYGSGAITNSYSAGAVVGTGLHIGGLVGMVNGGMINSSYYDRNVSGRNDTDKGEGRTTAQMKREVTFLGWDFNSAWGIDPTINNGYPYLLTLKNSIGITPIQPPAPNLQSLKMAVQTKGNNIVLTNVPLNTKVEVYNLQGKLIHRENPKIGGIGVQTIEVQTKGIYLVKVGTQTIRIAIR
jgi:hypothetical protein